jgi:hypothetical protein
MPLDSRDSLVDTAKVTATLAINRQLHRAEAAIEDAHKQTLDLQSVAIAARRDAKISSTVGVQAHAHFDEANTHLQKAREAMAAGHAELKRVAIRLGTQERIVEPDDKPGPGDTDPGS